VVVRTCADAFRRCMQFTLLLTVCASGILPSDKNLWPNLPHLAALIGISPRHTPVFSLIAKLLANMIR
jgi:hypothetical protein